MGTVQQESMAPGFFRERFIVCDWMVKTLEEAERKGKNVVAEILQAPFGNYCMSLAVDDKVEFFKERLRSQVQRFREADKAIGELWNDLVQNGSPADPQGLLKITSDALRGIIRSTEETIRELR